MTKNEYLELPWSVEDTIENLKEIKETMIAKARAVNLDGKAESDAKEIEFDFNRAISALEENQQYRALGTVEELREAREKQTPKKPNIWGDGYDEDGEIIYDMYDCPNCEKSYEIDYDKSDYCPECGQAIDWNEECQEDIKNQRGCCTPKYLGENTAIGCREGRCKCENIVRSYQKFCDNCGVRLEWSSVRGSEDK